MTTAIGTLTRTASITMTDARHVLWRIATDLRTLRAQHGLITPEREEQLAHDLLRFVYRNFVGAIEFQFLAAGTNTRHYAVRYDITRDWSGDEDDDAGGLRYQDLTGTSFGTVITESATWTALSADAKAAFYRELQCTWGPAGDVRDGAGLWATDRTYGSGGLGAARSVFRAR